MQTAHQHQSGHGHGHGNAHERAPQTEGRLIHWARLYDVLLKFKFLGRLGKLRDMTIDLAELKPGERVLDVGSGTGELAIDAARRVGPRGAVHGVDASPEMIEVARRKGRRTSRAVQFHLQPAEAMTFPDGSFDVAVSSFVMHHLPGDLKRRALLEVRRVLRPGGRVAILDMQPASRPPRPWQPGWIVSRLHKQRPIPEAEVRVAKEARVALLREAGFTDVKAGTTRYDWIGYTLGRVPE